MPVIVIENKHIGQIEELSISYSSDAGVGCSVGLSDLIKDKRQCTWTIVRRVGFWVEHIHIHIQGFR